MIDLAVTDRAETFERMREPLADRGIRVRHLQVSRRAVPIDPVDAPWSPDAFDVGFVFPGRIPEGRVADAFLDVPWVNDREAVLTSRNKAAVLARLQRAGVPVPETVLVSNPVDEATLRAVFERFDPPVVVKPNSTTRGVGVARVDDLDSFLGVCDYLELVHDYRATGDKSFLVQEYVSDAVDYRVMVLDGTVAGAVERRLPEEALEAGRWKHNVHRGAVATGADPSGQLGTVAEAVAAVLDVPFLGVDLLAAGDGERVLVTETNARPTIDDATKYDPDFYDRLATLIRERAGVE